MDMCHKIRAALMQPEDKLGGIVEMDETYVGGKDKNRHWDKKSGTAVAATTLKTPVIGAVKRKGNVDRPRCLERYRRKRRSRILCNETVSNKVSLLCDRRLARLSATILHRYPHGSSITASGQYVVGAVHTNTIEGFWSIFKRGVVGTFHKVSAKYMPLYVAEFQFRYNNRFNPDMFGTAIAGC